MCGSLWIVIYCVMSWGIIYEISVATEMPDVIHNSSIPEGISYIVVQGVHIRSMRLGGGGKYGSAHPQGVMPI